MAEQEATATAQATTEAAKGAEKTATEQQATATATATATTEQQAAEKTAEEAAKPTVPEKYELKLPEGSLLAPSDIERISTLAKEKGLSPEAAQELLEVQSITHREALDRQLETVRNEWATAAAADPEIGGAEFKQNAELASRVVERYFPEAKKVFDDTGFGNHPDMMRGFVRLGKAMSEDQLIHPRSQQGGGEQSMAERLYGKKS